MKVRADTGGLPKNARGYAWRRMIDGYRGTSWRVGSPGYFLAREGTRWPPEKTQRGDRWVEVKLPESKPIERIVVVSANTRFELLAGIGGKLTPLQAKSTQSRDYHQTEIADIAESALAPPQKVERLRLTFTRDALPDKPELIFEIEAYEAAQE